MCPNQCSYVTEIMELELPEEFSNGSIFETQKIEARSWCNLRPERIETEAR